jgi:hypothetical protein
VVQEKITSSMTKHDITHMLMHQNAAHTTPPCILFEGIIYRHVSQAQCLHQSPSINALQFIPGKAPVDAHDLVLGEVYAHPPNDTAQLSSSQLPIGYAALLLNADLECLLQVAACRLSALPWSPFVGDCTGTHVQHLLQHTAV